MKSNLLAPLFCTTPATPRNTGSGLSSGWCFTWIVQVSFFSFQKSERISHPSFFLWSWTSGGGPWTCDRGFAEQRSFPWLPRCRFKSLFMKGVSPEGLLFFCFFLDCFYSLTKSCLLCPWNSPGRNTVVGCHFLLQGIFSTQGSNPHLLHL